MQRDEFFAATANTETIIRGLSGAERHGDYEFLSAADVRTALHGAVRAYSRLIPLMRRAGWRPCRFGSPASKGWRPLIH